jgi:hypothetical protein
MESKKKLEKVPSNEELLKNIQEILDKNEERVVKELKPFAEKELDKDEIFACFEIFQMENHQLNYNTFFKKEKNGEKKIDSVYDFFNKKEGSFIPELTKYFKKVFNPDNFIQNENSEDGIKFSEDYEKKLQDWFTNCWKKAGGENAKVPTYFSFGKDYNFRDMFTGEVIDDEEEIASRLGYEGYTLL